MKTYKIHLIRHGITEGNEKGLYIGNRTDLPLSPAGKKELEKMRTEYDYPDVQKVYSGPLLRARESAEILYPGFEPHIIDELTEYDFGEFEGKSAEQLSENENFKNWTSGKLDAPSGGEKSIDFTKRIALGLNEIVLDMMKEGITSSAAIMHGGAIMMLLAACAVPRKRSVEWTCDAGRGYSVMITPSLYHSSGVIEVYDII